MSSLECDVSNTFSKNYKFSERLFDIENDMSNELELLNFKPPIEYVYNPLKYAKNLHENFTKKYFEKCTKKILFLGMNPGPWGMCQTGVVFGEKNFIKDWMKLSGKVSKPHIEHPKKKISGLECNRTEISGKKFWGFFKKLCKTPEQFFKHSFVYNHCCLAFMDATGKNITPPEIKDLAIKKKLYEICDRALIKILKEFHFEIIVAIGKFAEKNALTALKKNGIGNVKVLSIPHPSPRNAKNFSNWEEVTLNKLENNKLLKFFKDNQ
ncbi:Single-strand selective monofunctional uracil DNA glycosylase, putative [Pediculus humanus corporis]|uniref:Single-strand selective monofunctional uracil DNA glycosylase, putative n=1 Tax=Pediculus humanus subsp. corporis TaxID=121224 RepID=E0VUF8_PEDHC|nr:Single-strand selective monofunctional uracil DNA glycosylase, putative [Pediculus humanus corporis]EEB17014.1 Single-strand selective monofunctional uracil DNA glycosylase, putative [Pediculus humanus corporis]